MKIPLFDIDSTLIQEGNKAKFDAFNFAFKTVYGLPGASMSEIVTDGMIAPQIIIEVLKLHNVPVNIIQKKMHEAIQAIEDYFILHEDEGHYIVLPGVRELLNSLKEKRVPTGVLSGNLEKTGWRILELSGIKDYFDFGSFSNRAKTRVDLIPQAFTMLQEKYKNVKLSELLIVGDSPLDISCAKEGGIQVIAVASGIFSVNELQKAGADLVLTSLKEKEKFFKFISQ